MHDDVLNCIYRNKKTNDCSNKERRKTGRTFCTVVARNYDCSCSFAGQTTLMETNK